MFAKGSKISYDYEVDNPNEKSYEVDYDNYKMATHIEDDSFKSLEEWLGGEKSYNLIKGDLNKDNIEDLIVTLIVSGKEEGVDNQTETLVLLGTNDGRYKLYCRGGNLLPELYGKFGASDRNSSYEFNSIKKGEFVFETYHSNYYDYEELSFEFTFSWVGGNIVLTKLEKSIFIEGESFEQKINLPTFDLNLKDFDITFFVKHAHEPIDRY